MSLKKPPPKKKVVTGPTAEGSPSSSQSTIASPSPVAPLPKASAAPLAKSSMVSPPKSSPSLSKPASPSTHAIRAGGPWKAAPRPTSKAVNSPRPLPSATQGKSRAATAMVPSQPKPSGFAAAPRATERPPEDPLEALGSVVKVKVPDLFHGFMEKIAPKLRLPSTSSLLLEAFSSIDVNAGRVGQILKSNAYYEEHFMREVEKLAKRESVGSLEAAVVLLGMQNSRDLIIALQAVRSVRGGHPELTREGKLKIMPAELLKYALRTEELLAGKKGSHSETAYVAGLLFDVMALIAAQLSSDKKRVISYLDSVYNHGVRSAQLGSELAKGVQDFGPKKHVFSTCLIHDIGKVALAILEPSYVSFAEDCVKRKLPRNVRHFAETRRFGVDHALLGGLCCHYFSPFQVVEKAVFFHHQPYLLGAAGGSLAQLTSIVSLASNIANDFKRVEKPEDPVVALWNGPEQGGFQVDPRKMIEAVTRVV